MRYISCFDIYKLKSELNTGCCNRCHDDFNKGYSPLCESYYDNVTIEVCCKMEDRLTEEIKREIIELITKRSWLSTKR